MPSLREGKKFNVNDKSDEEQIQDFNRQKYCGSVYITAAVYQWKNGYLFNYI